MKLAITLSFLMATSLGAQGVPASIPEPGPMPDAISAIKADSERVQELVREVLKRAEAARIQAFEDELRKSKSVGSEIPEQVLQEIRDILRVVD